MTKGSTLFLKGVVLLLAIVVVAVCFGALYEAIRGGLGIYSPILIGTFFAGAPALFALYQTLKLLNYIDTNKAFSALSVKALKHIKYSAVVLSVLYTIGLPYIYYRAEIDDAPGIILVGLIFIFGPAVIATFAAVLQKILQDALAIKSENDLTI